MGKGKGKGEGKGEGRKGRLLTVMKISYFRPCESNGTHRPLPDFSVLG